MDSRLEAFQKFLDIVDEVRAKCPWDSIQTIGSIRHLTIEETYELSEAILKDDLQEVKKELGDLMLHLVLYSKIADELGAFDIEDVLKAISEKMIVRHPHIFGNDKVSDATEVLQNWEKIKLEKEHNRSVLGGVPASLPALLRAYRMQQKAAGIGFEWNNPDDAWEKVQEEKKEFLEAKGPEQAEEEFGDLLFALINYGRMKGINAEDAMDKANNKFKSRFTYIEQEARKAGQSVQNLSLDEMMNLWNEAKTHENV